MDKDRKIKNLQNKFNKLSESYAKVELFAMKKKEYLRIDQGKAKMNLHMKEIEKLKMERDMWKEEAMMYRLKYDDCVKFISKAKVNGNFCIEPVRLHERGD